MTMVITFARDLMLSIRQWKEFYFRYQNLHYSFYSFTLFLSFFIYELAAYHLICCIVLLVCSIRLHPMRIHLHLLYKLVQSIKRFSEALIPFYNVVCLAVRHPELLGTRRTSNCWTTIVTQLFRVALWKLMVCFTMSINLCPKPCSCFNSISFLNYILSIW